MSKVIAAVVLILAFISMRQDLTRYIQIKRISAGHPELVPAEGRKAYLNSGG